MKVCFGLILLTFVAGCQSPPHGEPEPEQKPTLASGIKVEKSPNGLEVVSPLRDVVCPAKCNLSSPTEVILPVVYGGSGEQGPPPGYPQPPEDGPDSPKPPHDPGDHGLCRLYAVTGDLYRCDGPAYPPPLCPGLIFSPQSHEFLDATMTYGNSCKRSLFKPYLVRPISEMTLKAGTVFVSDKDTEVPPPLPAPPSPPIPQKNPPTKKLNVYKHIVNADLQTVEFPQILRVDDYGFVVGSLAPFSAPTKINFQVRGRNPKGSVLLEFPINLVPEGEEANE